MRGTLPHLRIKPAITALLIAYLGVSSLSASAQTKKHWQAGTILEVKPHEGAPPSENAAKEYDVSIKAGKKIYVVLYAQENDQADPEFYVGVTRTVLVDGDTLKINDLQGNTRSAHILSSKDAPPSDSK
jgi:hypothetical protein